MRTNSSATPLRSVPGPPARGQRTAWPGRQLRIVGGAIVLVGLYTGTGAGIGAAAGSPLVGMLVGLCCGFCAVAAILLISGASVTLHLATEPSPRPVSPRSSPMR